MTQKKSVFGVFILVCALFAAATQAVAGVNYVLMDSDSPPKNVGFVSSVSMPENDPSVSSGSQPVMDVRRHVLTLLPVPKTGGNEFWKVGLRVDPAEIPFTKTNVYFEGNICNGQALILEALVELEFGRTFDPHAVLPNHPIPGTADLNTRVLYVADRSQPASVKVARSILTDEGCSIFPSSFIREFRPAVLIDSDLHTTYPPPYDLLFELVE